MKGMRVSFFYKTLDTVLLTFDHKKCRKKLKTITENNL
jgi:hypothetical protein